jgi:hypothetical protein
MFHTTLICHNHLKHLVLLTLRLRAKPFTFTRLSLLSYLCQTHRVEARANEGDSNIYEINEAQWWL